MRFFNFFLLDNFAKKIKMEDEGHERKISSRIKSEDENDSIPPTPESHHADGLDGDLQPLHPKTSPVNGSTTGPLKATSPTQSATLQQTHCQYMSSAAKSYSQSCMASSNDQLYYPHHSPINRTSPASSFLPVSTTSGLLQPVSSSLDLHNVNPQMQSCRLPQQTSDCALRQPSGHLPSSHNYGIRTTPPTQHPSLPSCTYMQPTQPYPTHLAPNVHMMNMNFTGPMAWTFQRMHIVGNISSRWRHHTRASCSSRALEVLETHIKQSLWHFVWCAHDMRVNVVYIYHVQIQFVEYLYYVSIYL